MSDLDHQPPLPGTEGVPGADPADRVADGRRLAGIGLIAAMGSRLIGRLVGIVLVVALAREADPGTVAVYGYLLGTATLVTVLTDLGVASVAGREVAAGRLPARGALSAALRPQLVSVLAAGAVTVLLCTVVGPDDVPTPALLLAVLFVIVGGLNNLWAELLRATGRVVLEGALQTGSAVALVVAGCAVVVLGGNADLLLLVVALKEVVLLLIGLVVLRPQRDPAVSARALLNQGVWVAVAGTAIVVLWRQGTMVVGGLGSVGMLATYVVATRYFDAGVTVAHTAGFGLAPGMSALATDPPAHRAAARRYLAVTTLAGAAVAVVGALLAGPLTTIPFGDEWASAVPAVRWIAVAALPVLLSHVSFTVLMSRGQQRWLAAATVTGAVTGVLSTLLLVHWRDEASSGVIGTVIGAVIMLAIAAAGIRDVLLPLPAADRRADSPSTREPEPVR